MMGGGRRHNHSIRMHRFGRETKMFCASMGLPTPRGVNPPPQPTKNPQHYPIGASCYFYSALISFCFVLFCLFHSRANMGGLRHQWVSQKRVSAAPQIWKKSTGMSRLQRWSQKSEPNCFHTYGPENSPNNPGGGKTIPNPLTKPPLATKASENKDVSQNGTKSTAGSKPRGRTNPHSFLTPNVVCLSLISISQSQAFLVCQQQQ